MLKRIWESTKPPTFPKEEENRLAYLLHITILILIIGSSVGAVTTLAFGFFQTSTALIAGLFGTAIAFILLKGGHLKTAIWTMLLSFVITLIIVMMLGDGSHDITILLFPVLIMVAALMLGKRSLILFTSILIITLQVVILGEHFGLFTNRLSDYTLFYDFISVSIILSITAVEAFLLSNSIKGALHRSLVNEKALKENNLKLENEIKENKRMGKVLFESEKKYRTLAETTTDAIFTLDNDGRFSFLNPTFERISGHSIKDFLGRPFIDLVAPEDVQKTLKSFSRGMSGKETPLYQVDVLCKSGEKVPIELSMSTLVDDDGKPIGRLGFARDIRDRIEKDQRIIFERNRAEFYLDLLSHDIANIQQGIYSSVQIAEFKKEDKQYMDNLVTSIKKLSKRSINLLNNAKILSRITDRELKTEPVNLSKIVHETITDAKDLFHDEDVHINLKTPQKDVYVQASPLISNIFFNLLHNGIKFQLGPKKIIDVEIVPGKNEKIVDISISDRGPGIPGDMKEVIFQRHIKGGDIRLSGIGLSLVKELVDRYNGTIRIKDRMEGGSVNGATFIVTMPLVI